MTVPSTEVRMTVLLASIYGYCKGYLEVIENSPRMTGDEMRALVKHVLTEIKDQAGGEVILEVPR